MDEKQIAEQLKQRITPPADTIIVKPDPPDTTYGQATTNPDYQLDEMTQYKLQDYFGEVYKDSDTAKRQQAQFVYDEISSLVGSKEYGFIIAKLRDLERVIGVAGTNNRLYRTYQWLKLDKTRRNIEAEMGAVIYE
jgi:hypothetical protein